MMFECSDSEGGVRGTASKKFLTEATEFRDVSRGNPKPFTIEGEALLKARLTPESWRLEIVSDGSTDLERTRRLDDGTAIDLPTLETLGKKHGVKFLKAMQCNNIAQPLGQGLWEGVPLREVLKLAGNVKNIRRVYYWGFHNNDPKQVFQSSLSYNQVMETPPWDLPVFVAYHLNGRPISLLRGGPVRMIVPWAHGFKSIKWLQRVILTNDYRANDTYAEGNNDIESYLKTAAYIDDGPQVFNAGEAITLTGTAMVGWSGLKRVEGWLRPDSGRHGQLDSEDPAWQTARWEPCQIEPPPDNWGGSLPDGVMPNDVWGFDRATGKPKEWPLRFSVAHWSMTVRDLKPGAYEFRARTVDLNGIAQPEPRPYPKSGRNAIAAKQFMVTA
jgi:DMSO/TMAO reductase YedYZ molybdopterin-dependent catalytic subunit